MGNDGGSIPGRADLVKVKSTSHKLKRAAELDRDDPAHDWRHCRLSGERLKKPIASDCFGRLYNREAVLRHLLSRSQDDRRSGESIEHIRSVKDVVELDLGTTKRDGEQFHCTVTRKDMDGSVRFCYIVPCGHAFARDALAMTKSDTCPVCEAPYDPTVGLVEINPRTPETRQKLVDRMTSLTARNLTHSLKLVKRTKHSKQSTKKRKLDDPVCTEAEPT